MSWSPSKGEPIFSYDLEDLAAGASSAPAAAPGAEVELAEQQRGESGSNGAAGPGGGDSRGLGRAEARVAMLAGDALLSTGELKREASASAPPPRVGRCGLVLLNAAWFASSFCWFLLLIVIVPSQIAGIVGQERKGAAIGAVLGGSTPVVLLGAPIAGVLSDRVRSAHGRRRPLLLPGSLLFSAVLLALVAAPHTLLQYGLLYTALRTAELLVSAPFNGLIADLTPPELRGLASGVMGAASNLGSFAGAAVGVQYTVLGPLRTALGMCVVMVAATAATCLAAPEASTSHQPPPEPLRPGRLLASLAAPLRNADFAWVFATRLIFQMGVYTVQEFLQFYFRDAVQLPPGLSPEAAVSYGMLCLMTAAMLTAAAGGLLSDALGGRRKALVYAAGALMSASCLAVALSGRSMGVTLFLLSLFGLGYGCYLAVDFAMVLDVLPHPDDAAKDMAVWSVALTLPQMLATPIGGLLLDEVQRRATRSDPGSILGYQCVFSLAAFYLVLSTVLVWNIKGVR